MHMKRRGTGFAGLGFIVFLIGCQPTGAPQPPGPAAAAPGASTGPQPSGPTAGAPTAPEGFDADSGPNAAGKKVFVANGCFRCHAINGVRGSGGPGGPPPGSGGPPGPGGPPPGPGGPGRPHGPGGRGPDLGKVGADESHTAAWLMEYVRNPKSKKADSRMPRFEGKIKDDDLTALADYLAGLK